MNDVDDDDDDDDIETGADDDNFSMEELSFAQILAFSGGSPQTPGMLFLLLVYACLEFLLKCLICTYFLF